MLLRAYGLRSVTRDSVHPFLNSRNFAGAKH